MCLHSLHKVCICFHKLITCALSVPDADFADLVQTLQTRCNKTPIRPVLACQPYKHHRPDCTQTLQTLRPCPKSPDSKRTYSQPPMILRHGTAKRKVAKNTAESSALARLPNQDYASKRAQTLQTLRPYPEPTVSKVWVTCVFLAPTSSPQNCAQNESCKKHSWNSKSHVNWQKQYVTEVVPPHPNHACWLSIRLGERAAPLAVPQDRQIELMLGCWSSSPWSWCCTHNHDDGDAYHIHSIYIDCTQNAYCVHTDSADKIKLFVAQNIFEELNCARECPRFDHPYMERYDILCCPVSQVVVFWLTFYF